MWQFEVLNNFEELITYVVLEDDNRAEQQDITIVSGLQLEW